MINLSPDVLRQLVSDSNKGGTEYYKEAHLEILQENEAFYYMVLQNLYNSLKEAHGEVVANIASRAAILTYMAVKNEIETNWTKVIEDTTC